jgi:2-aminoethylphosphonate-pyruvate transaminase
MLSAFLRLLTPGPLALSPEVRASMQSDLGSRDLDFRQITCDIRNWILDIAGATPSHSVVPVQGSGTFAIEGVLTTFITDTDKVLVCINGIYGETATKILRRHEIQHTPLNWSIKQAIRINEVEAALEADPDITHLYFVHCETTSGIVNPLSDLLSLARRRGIVSIVDSMSAFGALEVDARIHPFDILIASGNKCVEAPPGIAFAIIRRSLLKPERTAPRTYTLDLFDQWMSFETTEEWRSTPPTHVAQALHTALIRLRQETVAGRRHRYAAVRDRLIAGMAEFGIRPILPAALQSPICVAFHSDELIPDATTFASYYNHLRDAGLLIYARYHQDSRSFRIGCIGQIEASWVDDLLAATRRFAELRMRPPVNIRARPQVAVPEHSL